MATPTTREEFKKYCLRNLGEPVIKVNIEDDQTYDRIDDALEYFRDYHYDGSERTFLKHQVTADDITNEYITIPQNITGVMRVMPIGTGLNTNNIFNYRYQLTLNDVETWGTAPIQNYVSTMERISLLQDIFTGMQIFRFNRHTDRLYIDTNWNERMIVGQYVVIECRRVIEPDTYASVWNDRWLKEYATQLIKRQWGTNMKKFSGMRLPGDVEMNGQTIYDEANERIKELEEEMINKYTEMPSMVIA